MNNGDASVLKPSEIGTAETHTESVATPPWRRGFWSLVVTQFQGAFNENGLKNLVIFIILEWRCRKPTATASCWWWGRCSRFLSSCSR